MSYRIKKYSLDRAKSIGVEIKPSKSKGKKLDVFKDGKKIASIGALGYMDYPTYLEKEKAGKVAKGTANKKRQAYKARHIFRKNKWSNSWLADQILW